VQERHVGHPAEKLRSLKVQKFKSSRVQESKMKSGGEARRRDSHTGGLASRFHRRELLFGRYFAGELAHHYFAQVVAFFACFDHGVARAVMFGDNGCGFGVEGIHRRVVRI
jgi:hypothetical protein